MLAATLRSLDDIRPERGWIIQPKYDGIRCLIYPNGTALSRTGKLFPNVELRQQLKVYGAGDAILDGELHVIDSQNFQQIESIVMSQEHAETTLVHFQCFDCYNLNNPRMPAKERLLRYNTSTSVSTFARETLQEVVASVCRMNEGAILRALDSRYKQGRSTLAEGSLLKWKPFAESDAIIIGFEEATTIHGDKKNMLGSFHLRDIKTGVQFSCGSGLTESQRMLFWQQREKVLGRIVNYKYQQAGMKDKPRSPVFLKMKEQL